jgi:hypothetical protein
MGNIDIDLLSRTGFGREELLAYCFHPAWLVDAKCLIDYFLTDLKSFCLLQTGKQFPCHIMVIIHEIPVT